jgi:hypothetical protein
MSAIRICSLALTVCLLVKCSTGTAHTQWGDGSPVSEDVKRMCCGEAEVHLLAPGSVRALKDGWHIDGYAKVIPYGKELPSPDGNDWGFWADHAYDGFKIVAGQSEMHCLFLNPRNN